MHAARSVALGFPKIAEGGRLGHLSYESTGVSIGYLGWLNPTTLVVSASKAPASGRINSLF